MKRGVSGEETGPETRGIRRQPSPPPLPPTGRPTRP